MKINWFPGHMHKALKEITQELKKVDVVLYVLDARIPVSSLNPTLSKIAENKPILYVINKIDMADEIFVINVNGYIGESTKSEIQYALNKGKKVNYLE